VDLRAGLDDVEKRKFLTLPGLELQHVASRYTDYAILVVMQLQDLLKESEENLRNPRKVLSEYKIEEQPNRHVNPCNPVLFILRASPLKQKGIHLQT
jgi:hypothetical protein